MLSIQINRDAWGQKWGPLWINKKNRKVFASILKFKYDDSEKAYAPLKYICAQLHDELLNYLQGLADKQNDIPDGLFLSEIESVENNDEEILLTYAVELNDNLLCIIEIISDKLFSNFHNYACVNVSRAKILSRACEGLSVRNSDGGRLESFYCSKQNPYKYWCLKLIKIEPLLLQKKDTRFGSFSSADYYFEKFIGEEFSISINSNYKTISISSSIHDEGPLYRRGYSYYWRDEFLRGSSEYSTLHDMVDAVDSLKKVFEFEYDSLSILRRTDCSFESVLDLSVTFKTYLRPEYRDKRALNKLEEITGIPLGYSEDYEHERNN